MENEKTVIAPVVTVDNLNHDYRTLIIHSHINFMGKMVLNETEAALLLVELWRFIFPSNLNTDKQFTSVDCTNDITEKEYASLMKALYPKTRK